MELPETKPASEYIDGQIIQKPMPQGHHSIIQSELSSELILKNINHCLTHGSQMGWLIDPGDRSVIVSVSGYSAEVVDEPAAILPVPGFAKSLEISIEQMFGWLNLV